VAQLFRRVVAGNRYIKIILDFVAVILGFFVALSLRFELSLPTEQASRLLLCLPLLILVFYLFNSLMGIYAGRWKYASFDELLNLSSAGSLSTVSIFLGTLLIPRARSYLPISVSVIGPIISLFVMGFIRLQYRLFGELRLRGGEGKGKKVLLVGAGEAGEMVARDMLRHPEYGYYPEAFVDDDPAKRNLILQGVPVMGNRKDIPTLVLSLDIDEIFITVPSLEGEELRAIVSICEQTDAPIKILPPLVKMAGRRISAFSVRELRADDLLGREPFQVDVRAVADTFSGCSVLITGGSGSIGSRLAHHVASFGPSKVILLDNNESGLFEVEGDLKRSFPEMPFEIIMADIRDESRIRRIFHRHKPDYVFHTAASKHVPMMELHPTEAVKNNILGTKILADAARANSCRGFLFFSSIKAEKPDNIMGVTKNVAERLLYFLNEDGGCRFASFRLGNVLGTRGSVTTVFEKLIRKGGPITLTHPDASRYFLTIDEASLMVIQACVMARGGEIFFPDMGKPVKIKDLAESMIGILRPEQDIEFVITGLRPGERIQEELLLPVDLVKPTEHQRIFRLDYHFKDREEFNRVVSSLLDAAMNNEENEVKRLLAQLAPHYKPRLNMEEAEEERETHQA